MKEVEEVVIMSSIQRVGGGELTKPRGEWMYRMSTRNEFKVKDECVKGVWWIQIIFEGKI